MTDKLPLCRIFPNATMALRLLKHIVNKYPDIIQQGFGAGLEEASRFQAILRKSVDAEKLPALQRAALLGFKKLYHEVLLTSRAARSSLLVALIKRFEAACDPVNPEVGNLKLLHLCAQVSSCLPLGKMHELLVLLRPIHQIISRHGDAILAAIKQAQPKGPGPKQRAACIAMVYLLLLNNFLIQRYGLTKDQLAALEETAEKRKAEENRELQVAPEAGDRLLEVDGVDTKDLTEQYTGLKLLMQTFSQFHSFVPVDTSDSNGQSDVSVLSTSPVAARTPLWALNSTDLAKAGSGKLLKRRNSTSGRKVPTKTNNPRRKSNLSRSMPQKKRKSGCHSESDSQSEQDDALERHLKKKAARPRRRLEKDLAKN